MKERKTRSTANARPDPVQRDQQNPPRQKSRFSSPHAPGRSDKTLPADRGAREQESESQGSE